MANEWFRLWHDMPNDPKWRTIARVAGQPVSLVLSVALHVMADASRNVTRGHVDVTTEDLASALDVTEADIQAIRDAMQGRVMDGDRLTGWEKRQPKREDVGSPETGAKSAAERKRAQRERERSAAGGDASLQGHDGSRKVTTDKDKEKEKDKKQPPPNPRQRGQSFDASAIDLPDWLDREDWAAWVADRKARKKPITEKAAELQIKQLAGLRQQGHAPADVIAHSIASSYQGLFAPSTSNRTAQPGKAQRLADWNDELRNVLAESGRPAEIFMGTIDATH
ncbi:phage protein [Bordetella trematum]|uniref:Phage protein n=1 Tax=Bordetella trematum TaxID=123899 RepID=A0A157RKX0_9BORD|nr:hypothetical protein [Bordetella trematum]NNH19117.1 hypothetical protein [Bordetella trematum]SAI58554.1 phage protein [Bordetella trematum]SAI73899.1 phage protein [Bordetella trematum]SUV97148.1 phage protein [Bordetella trematum]